MQAITLILYLFLIILIYFDSFILDFLKKYDKLKSKINEESDV